MSNKCFIVSQILVFVLCSYAVTGQAPAEPEKDQNFGYSRNPPAKTSADTRKRAAEKPGKTVDARTEQSNQPGEDASAIQSEPVFTSIAQKTREIARKERRQSANPTEIYKVGGGDVLFIGLEASRSNYFTVLGDGAIDFPLAGGLVQVSGLTVDEIEEVLRERIQLYEKPEVSVKVREYASHGIDLLGLVGRAGKHYLQREAMPLYVVRASAIVEPDADLVIVKRPGAENISIRQGDAGFDETLIFPGDVVEFVSSETKDDVKGFVYIGGAVKESGRFSFQEGMTLTQAIIVAGGTESSKVKKAVILRKNESGFLDSSSHKLSDIKKGKAKDPVLQAGDMIEVGS